MSVKAYWYVNFFKQAFSALPAYGGWKPTGGDTFRIMLATSAYKPNQDTHVSKNDITGEVSGPGYTAGGQILTSKTISAASGALVLGAAPVQWAAATFSVRWAIIYDDTNSAALSKQLVRWVDFGQVIELNNQTLALTFDGQGNIEIDVSPPVTPPFLAGMPTVNDNHLFLSFSEALNTSFTPATSAFAVMVTGVARTVSSVLVFSNQVTLTLASGVLFGESVTVAYTVPASNFIRDLDGSPAANIPATACNNITPEPPVGDITPPVLTAALVNLASLTLTYDENLNQASVPATGAFAVTVNGVSRSVTAVGVSSASVLLSLATPVNAGQTVLLSYTAGGAPIEDTSGNNAANLVNQAVTNQTVGDTTPPVLAGLTVDAATLTLSYSEVLAPNPPPVSAFTCLVNGSTRSVTNATVSNQTVTLTLGSAVVSTDTVTLTYLKPSANPLEDLAGNDAANFSSQPVVNVTTPAPPPIDGASFVSQSMPSTITAGQVVTATVTMRNSGTTNWSSATGYRLRSQNPEDNNFWGVASVPVPAPTLPNSNVTFSFSVTAPQTPGTYAFQWCMAKSTVSFGSTTTNINVTVNAVVPPPVATVTVTAPNGSEDWNVSTVQTIRWLSSNVTGNVRIELSRNGGSVWETLFTSTANDGNETWTVSGTVGTQNRIRVTSINEPAASDVSNANFTISAIPPPPATITVVAPNGGENWQIGSTQTIRWSSANLTGNVKVELSPDGGTTWATIFASIANDGSENWIVSGGPETDARVRISSVTAPSVLDISNADFTISNPVVTSTYQGFGANTMGGTGQPVYTVTHLGTIGAGSLYDAIQGSNRYIRFNVSGNIVMDKKLRIRGSNITIDGSTAPSPGITIKRYGFSISGNDTAVHDVVITGLRVRLEDMPIGQGSDEDIDGFQIDTGANIYNIVVDHCSFSGGPDENVGLVLGVHDVTFSWCIIATPQGSTISGGGFSRNFLCYAGTHRITVHHNLFIGATDRNPQFNFNVHSTTPDTDTTGDIRNNYVVVQNGGYGTMVSDGAKVNNVANYYATTVNGDINRAFFACPKPFVNPNTGNQFCDPAVHLGAAGVYATGNVTATAITVPVDAWSTVSTPFPAPTVTTSSALSAAQQVYSQAGVRPLDATDQALLGLLPITARYASPTGTGTACTLGQPCSLSTAISQAVPGDQVILLDGIYSQPVVTARDGTSATRITIRANTLHQAIVRLTSGQLARILHSYITVSGIRFDGQFQGGFPGIAIGNSPNQTPLPVPPHHVIVENCIIEHVRAAGFQIITGEHDIILRDNLIDGTGYIDPWGEAFYIGGAPPVVYNIEISGNTVRDFTENGVETGYNTYGCSIHHNIFENQVTGLDHGVIPADPLHEYNHGTIALGGHDHVAYSNIIRNCKAGIAAITIRAAGNSKAYNNVIYNTLTETFLAVRMDDYSAPPPGGPYAASEVYNNTFNNLTNADVGFGLTASTLKVVNNLGVNLAVNLAAPVPSNYYVNAAAGNFHLTALAVNAIGKATTPPFSTTDFDGNPVVGVRDYGAFEF